MIINSVNVNHLSVCAFRELKKKVLRLFLKIMFIHKIRRSVLEWSCAFDMTHLDSNEQCRTPRGELILL